MLNETKRIVIKLGSSLVIGEGNSVREQWLSSLVADIAALKQQGKSVVVVTSGAVALGRGPLGYGSRALSLEEKQAAAACGQISLVAAWQQALAKENLYPAQLLLTAEDSIHRTRYLNARNTLAALLESPSAVPIVNENDTVATAELKFGDNDRLAARVAQLTEAELLVLFSDVDGLYSANPAKDNSAKHIDRVEHITLEIEAMAGSALSAISSGGMITKIAAAKLATAAGCHMMIAPGKPHHPLAALQEGGVHTLFVAKGNPRSARKEWIAGSLHPAGSITVDDGAARALAAGKSLLPAGVIALEGSFDLGEAVEIKDSAGRLLGKGLITYASVDAAKIIGKQSSEIEAILGFKRRDVLIHRNDMVLE